MLSHYLREKDEEKDTMNNNKNTEATNLCRCKDDIDSPDCLIHLRQNISYGTCDVGMMSLNSWFYPLKCASKVASLN